MRDVVVWLSTEPRFFNQESRRGSGYAVYEFHISPKMFRAQEKVAPYTHLEQPLHEVAATILDLPSALYQARADDLPGLHGPGGGRFMVNVVKLLRVYGG